MESICIYHTRTGISEQIAKQIAQQIGAEVLAVTDGKSYKGFFGYISAAVAGLKKKLPTILPYKTACPLEEYGRVIIVAPIWCENVSPIMRSFLAQNKNSIKGELFYVISSMSGLSYQNKIDALCDITGRPYTDILQVKSHKNDWQSEVAAFAEKL
ncbi:MAG: hypothetical protein KBS41_00540 [Oscillospiraceae bacterium]|nr:hypothetical protein [Candidatus Equicaccousia limihippi]